MMLFRPGAIRFRAGGVLGQSPSPARACSYTHARAGTRYLDTLILLVTRGFRAHVRKAARR